jgi:hypothetical protein
LEEIAGPTPAADTKDPRCDDDGDWSESMIVRQAAMVLMLMGALDLFL